MKYREIAPVVAKYPNAKVDFLCQLTGVSKNTVANARAFLGIDYDGYTCPHRKIVEKILKNNPDATSYDINQETGISLNTIRKAALFLGIELASRQKPKIDEARRRILKAASSEKSVERISRATGHGRELIVRILEEAGVDRNKICHAIPDDDLRRLYDSYRLHGPSKTAGIFKITKNAAIGRYNRYKKKICG